MLASLGIDELAADFSLKERTFFIEERILLKGLPQGSSNFSFWIPYPARNNWQAIEDFKVESPFYVSIITDKEYGNKIIYIKSRQDALRSGIPEVKLSFKVKRKECCAPSADRHSVKELNRFLKPDRLVPINGKIKKLAQKITQDKNDDLEKIRAIYDYIIDELTYSKDDPNICGVGDSLLTLQYKKGICTDYHSLFISLVRSLGIPAKFEIGFRIPEEINTGKLNGYHCWAKFYLKDKGWIPVDISEADKHPEKRDYYFGHIDENRLHLTTGRDIALKYTKDSKPLNFFVYPYAELNGLQFNDIDFEISFKNLKGGERR